MYSAPSSAGGSRPGTPAVAPLTTDTPFQVRDLFWEQLKQFINQSEREEVAIIIGKRLIEDNEV